MKVEGQETRARSLKGITGIIKGIKTPQRQDESTEKPYPFAEWRE
jgi:hypothetical protein